MIKGFIFLLIFTSSLAQAKKGGFLPPAFIADFMQVKKSKVSSKKIESPVKVKYAYPDGIHFEIAGKNAVTYVCNSKKVWIYNPPFMEGSRGVLKIGDSSNFCYSKLFTILHKGVQSNKHYKVTVKSKEHYHLKFSDKTAREIGFEQVELYFDKSGKKELGAVESFTLLALNDDQPVKFIKKSFTKLKTLKQGTFDFKPPKNTDITTLK